MTDTMRSILEDSATAVIFDVDGTLTDYAYGATHAQLELDFEDREAANATNIYANCRRIETMGSYIDRHGMQRIACLSTEATGRAAWKAEMLGRNYGIPAERIFMVPSSDKKVTVARDIAERLFADAERVVIVDDDIATLARFQQETDFLTATPMTFVL